MKKVSKPFIVIIVAALLFLAYVLLSTGKKKVVVQPVSQVPIPRPSGLQVTKPPKQDSPARKNEVPGIEYEKLSLSWNRDPFLLPKEVQGTKPHEPGVALRLVGIIEGKNGKIAIIDQEAVRLGESIGIEKVVQIGKDYVVLSHGRKQRTLFLEEAAEKIFTVDGKGKEDK